MLVIDRFEVLCDGLFDRIRGILHSMGRKCSFAILAKPASQAFQTTFEQTSDGRFGFFVTAQRSALGLPYENSERRWRLVGLRVVLRSQPRLLEPRNRLWTISLGVESLANRSDRVHGRLVKRIGDGLFTVGHRDLRALRAQGIDKIAR